MAHKGIRHLGMAESTVLAYDQAGFDLMSMDDRTVGGMNWKAFNAGSGTDVDNYFYLDIPTNGTAHWIGIHNCGTFLAETASVQAKTLGEGDDLSKTTNYGAGDLTRYFEIMPGDIVYGKFTEVALVRTGSGVPIPYVDVLRLIRGT